MNIGSIRAAANRLKGVACYTPLMESPELNARVNGRILIKPECLQRTGSFKFRGAYNRLSQLSAEQRRAGVVAWSSGNHAQGIAAAAQLLNMSAVIVMPRDAPMVKKEKTLAYGAEVVGYDRYRENREAIANCLAEQRGAVLVPSYEDVDIISGQGTCGLEFADQVGQANAQLDTLLIGCGGGGLTAGMSVAFSALSPSTSVCIVEPEGFDDYGRSLLSGKRETNSPHARSICDALLAPTPGELTFSINRSSVDRGFSVNEEQVREAVRFAFSSLKLAVEPGGAVALAAVLCGKLPLRGKTTGIVLSGGNVDPDMFAGILGDV